MWIGVVTAKDRGAEEVGLPALIGMILSGD
jgi:hypothetical protein